MNPAPYGSLYGELTSSKSEEQTATTTTQSNAIFVDKNMPEESIQKKDPTV